MSEMGGCRWHPRLGQLPENRLVGGKRGGARQGRRRGSGQGANEARAAGSSADRRFDQALSNAR